MMPGAFDASFPADHSVEAAEVPTLPTQHVLPKALPVALSLIKLASTLPQATQALVDEAGKQRTVASYFRDYVGAALDFEGFRLAGGWCGIWTSAIAAKTRAKWKTALSSCGTEEWPG